MQHQQENQGVFSRIWKIVSTVFIFILLIATLLISSVSMLQGQMLRMGERMFGNPDIGLQYSVLRADPAKPQCDPNLDVDAAVKQRVNENKNDEFADLFDSAVDEDAIRQSVLGAQQLCKEKFAMYKLRKDNITPAVRAYRTVETALLGITGIGVHWKHVILMLILAIAAINTTLGLHHIALRPPSTKRDFQVYGVHMVVANMLLLYSSSYYLNMQINSDIAEETSKIIFHSLWVLLFAVLLLVSIYKLIKPPKATEQGSWLKAGLSVPLFASMAIITGVSFIFFMDYKPGIAIRLGQMHEHANIFLTLSLFIWIGMLLKQTVVVDYFLDLVRPFNFSPETLSVILMIGAAILTAYTGASGIFVIAAGAIIYREVYNSGARRQYALAMTAMSGSLGVVLRPCLLIVLIAALNNKVTTDALYGKGLYVFLISTSLLFIFSLFLAKEKFKLKKPSVAIPESADALRAVSPYITVALLVIVFFSVGLETSLDESTAAIILPFVLLMVLFYDKKVRGTKLSKKLENITPVVAVPVLAYGVYKLIMAIISGLLSWFSYELNMKAVSFDMFGTQSNFYYLAITLVAVVGYVYALKAFVKRGVPRESHTSIQSNVGTGSKITKKGFISSVGSATYETIGHIGALILLMALSVALGGLIEDSRILDTLPTDFASTFTALILFTFILVLIGMVMDPFGAAILVNATIAGIAYNNGIHPVHFWIIVLAAFELGYLSPPVALNQLLARQVVGEKEMADADAEVRHKSFYWRYERWILPFTIMLITLIIVSLAPYLFKMFGWYG